MGLRPEDRQRRGASVPLRIEQSRASRSGAISVFVGTMDARMVALDRETGAVRWETPVIDWRQGYSITGAPLVVKDMVLTGVAGGEFGIRGFVKAFDARTGAARWTAYTIPGPGEPGHETWPGETWRHGGGPTWTTGVSRPGARARVLEHRQRRAVELPRAGRRQQMDGVDDRASTPSSGTIRWGYQYTPHDCWDYDAVSTPVLADVVLGDRGLVKALFHHDKNGFFYALDRTNGTVSLRRSRSCPGLPGRAGLDPETGRPRVNEAMIATSGGPEVGPIVPSLEGSIDWQPLAFNPDLGLIYFMSNQWAMGFKFWALDKVGRRRPTANGILGADYQQYSHERASGQLRGFRCRAPHGALARGQPGAVLGGRGRHLRRPRVHGRHARLFHGARCTHRLDPVAVPDGLGHHRQPDHLSTGRTAVSRGPSGGIGGDMTFYYKEPESGKPVGVRARRRRSRPRADGDRDESEHAPWRVAKVGEPGSTLGGRVLPGCGFPATDGTAPIQGEAPPQPTAASSAVTPAATQEAISTGERLYRGRCVGCHQAGGASGPNIFRTALSEADFAVYRRQGARGDIDAGLRVAAHVRGDSCGPRLRAIARPSPVMRSVTIT